MKKIVYQLLEYLLREERRIGKVILSGVKKNPLRVHIFILFTTLIIVSSFLPYLNIVFDTPTSVFVVGLLGILLFYPSSTMVMFLVMLMVGASMIVSLAHHDELAERIGNLTYGALWIFVCRYIVELWQKKTT